MPAYVISQPAVGSSPQAVAGPCFLQLHRAENRDDMCPDRPRPGPTLSWFLLWSTGVKSQHQVTSWTYSGICTQVGGMDVHAYITGAHTPARTEVYVTYMCTNCAYTPTHISRE